jgi:protein TonB
MKIKLHKPDLFKIALFISLFIHGTAYAIYFISSYNIFTREEFTEAPIEQEVDFDWQPDIPAEIPAEMVGQGSGSNPAPVEKMDWVEGTGDSNSPDAAEEEIDFNAVSGNGTDKDGYLFYTTGDSQPVVQIDFDLARYFPPAAKKANITEHTVLLSVQIDEKGKLQGAKIASRPFGYGFEEAALRVARLARFRPGFRSGVAVKMRYTVSIHFILD